MGASALAERHWISQVNAVFFLLGALLSPFMEFTLAMDLIAVLPIAVQEMVMALWLIVKGWNPATSGPSTAESGFAKPDMNQTMRTGTA